jgi:hypothetical protein
MSMKLNIQNLTKSVLDFACEAKFWKTEYLNFMSVYINDINAPDAQVSFLP